MLKNYPVAHLFLLSLVTLIILFFITPLVGAWHFYCAIVLDILNFLAKVVCGFLLFFTFIEIGSEILPGKKRLH